MNKELKKQKCKDKLRFFLNREPKENEVENSLETDALVLVKLLEEEVHELEKRLSILEKK